MGGCGTQTSALGFGGGSSIAATEEYNGTSWAAGGNLTTGRGYPGSAGTQAAGLCFGGYTGSASALTEEYTNGGTPVTRTVTST